MKSKPPTLVVVAATPALNGLGPSPSPLVLTRIVAGPSPPVEVSQACTTAPPGEMARSPKLQPVVFGIVKVAMKAPMLAVPRPVTGAPRATIWSLWFQTIQTCPAPTATVGWSTLAGPNVIRFVNVNPPSVLRMVSMFWRLLLIYVMKRFPKVSHASVGSQQAGGPSPAVPLAIVFEGSG